MFVHIEAKFSVGKNFKQTYLVVFKKQKHRKIENIDIHSEKSKFLAYSRKFRFETF